MGKGSKTWNKTAAERAIQMEAENIDPRTIWKETGTWRGPDDQWRQEIDDSGLHVRSTAERKEIADNLKARRKEIEGILKDPKAHQGLSPKELATEQRNLRAESRRIDNSLQDIHAPDAPSYSGSRAKYAFDHNPLFAAYPRLGDAVVRQDYVGEEYGLFSPDAISLNKALKRLGLQNSVTAHELQHGVQDTEGFARGGPPEEVAEFIEFAKKARRKANEITASRELRSMHESGLSHQEAIDAYKNKTGEDPSLSAFAYLNYTPDELEAQMADARREFAKYNVFSHFKDPFEGYRYLGGEAEARMAQARLKMTPEQRRAVFPEDSYDVPIDRLVNIYK